MDFEILRHLFSLWYILCVSAIKYIIINDSFLWDVNDFSGCQQIKATTYLKLCKSLQLHIKLLPSGHLMLDDWQTIKRKNSNDGLGTLIVITVWRQNGVWWLQETKIKEVIDINCGIWLHKLITLETINIIKMVLLAIRNGRIAFIDINHSIQLVQRN